MADGCRTDDMALATVLAIANYPYTLAKLTERKAVWDFSCTDDEQEDFDTLIDEYNDFTGRVEPRQFILRFMEMRQELFAYLREPSRLAAPRAAQS